MMQFIHENCVVSLSKIAARQTPGVKFLHNGLHHAVLSCSSYDLKQEYFDEYKSQKGISHELLRRPSKKILGHDEHAKQGENESAPEGEGTP